MADSVPRFLVVRTDTVCGTDGNVA